MKKALVITTVGESLVTKHREVRLLDILKKNETVSAPDVQELVLLYGEEPKADSEGLLREIGEFLSGHSNSSSTVHFSNFWHFS